MDRINLGLPGLPIIFNITVRINTVTIHWSSIKENGGYPLSDVVYYVQYLAIDNEFSASGINYDRTANTSKTFVTFTINEDAATPYAFRVVSINPAGIKIGDWKHGQIQGRF